jgi:hypothetical protein
MILFGGEWRTFEGHQQELHNNKWRYSSQEWDAAVDGLRAAQSKVLDDIANRESVRAATEAQDKEDRQIVLAALMWFQECLKSGVGYDMSHLNETLEDVGLDVDTVTDDHIDGIIENITFGS